jgi:hypothetical protein
MIERAELAPSAKLAPLLAGPLMLCTAMVAAQSSTPATSASDPARATGTLVAEPAIAGELRSSTAEQPNVVVLQSLESSDPTGPAVQFDDYRAKLREQLADPKQREALIKERLLQQRASNPDLGRVLRIDAATETKLLSLLVDQSLANELNASPFSQSFSGSVSDVMQQQADSYNQQISDIIGLIGRQRLDAYLDYQRTLAARNQVEDFAAVLAEPLRLSNEQKDGLVTLLAEEEGRRQRGSRVGVGAGGILREQPLSRTPEDRKLRALKLQIYLNEQRIRQTDTADRELVERLPRVLSPEQTQIFAERRARQLAELRARTEVLRREAGVGANELLPTEAAAPALNANLRLQIDLKINGKALNKWVTTRGAAVGFAGPEGLAVEIEPTLIDTDTLSAEVRFYESAPGKRRLVGSVGSALVRPTLEGAPASNASSGPSPVSQQSAYGQFTSLAGPRGFTGFNTLSLVLQGRQAYLVELAVSGKRL